MCPTTNSNIQLMKLYCANDSDLCASFYACDFVDFNSVGLQSSLLLIELFFQIKKIKIEVILQNFNCQEQENLFKITKYIWFPMCSHKCIRLTKDL